MNIVVLGNGNLYIFENERKGIINTKFYTLGYVEGSSKVGGGVHGVGGFSEGVLRRWLFKKYPLDLLHIMYFFKSLETMSCRKGCRLEGRNNL